MFSKKKLKLTIISFILLSGFLSIGSNRYFSVSGTDWSIEDTFTANGDIFHIDITTAVNPSVVHILLNFTTATEATISLSVYNITAGNNTQIWNSGYVAYTERFEKSIHLNITVESTGGSYPAKFKLFIHENEIELLTDEEEYTWKETFYASGDFNYLEITYTEMTIVNIHTQLDITGLDDFELHTKVSPDYYEGWMYADGPEEEETHLTFQADPGDVWTVYFELIGNPNYFPMNFTVNIGTTDKVIVDSTTETYTNSLSEENQIDLYSIDVTETPQKLRWHYVANYTLTIDIYNETEQLYHDWDEGDHITFVNIDTYLFKVSWETPIAGVKNNYTLRMQLGNVVIDLVPETITIIDDIFFGGLDEQPGFTVNIPSGVYQLKIIELGDRHDWELDFTNGYTDSWKNYYYTTIIIVPPFPIQVHNWKELVYSKLTNITCSFNFILDRHGSSSDYEIGFLIREYTLPNDLVQENLDGDLRNFQDFDFYRVNLQETQFLNMSLNSQIFLAQELSVEIFDEDFIHQGIWEINHSSYGIFEPTFAGYYYLKIMPNDNDTYSYSLTIKILEVTKKGTGLNFGYSILSILSLELIIMIYMKKKSQKK